MSITVGTDTYISLVDAKSYAAANGLTLAPTDPEIEALLIRAAKSMDRIYGARYLGQKQQTTQPMAWLRYIYQTTSWEGDDSLITVDSDDNPRNFSDFANLPELGWAQTELAAQIQAGVDIYAQQAPGVKRTTNRVDTLEETIEYSGGAGYAVDPLYTVTLTLRPLLRNSTGAIAITRGA